MTLRKKNILITGGAGFIGSHLAIELANSNTVSILDSFDSAVRTPKELSDHGIKVRKGSILNDKNLSQALIDIDVVFHLAVACVRLSLANPMIVHDVNSTGTLKTLIASKHASVKRFIAVSSSEAYGSATHKKMPETHPADPVTVYGMSKYMEELYANLYHRHFGLPVIVVRPFNTYGPYSHFEGVYGEVVPRFVVRALAGKQPTIFGDGKQTRDFTYISDTVRGLIQAAECDDLLGQTINIARGNEVSISEIAKIICKETGIPYKPIMLPPRPNDVRRHAANIAKAKKLLHYNPRVPIDEGLKKYIDWVKKTIPKSKKILAVIPDRNW